MKEMNKYEKHNAEVLKDTNEYSSVYFINSEQFDIFEAQGLNVSMFLVSTPLKTN